jgi:hypothetical protein
LASGVRPSPVPCCLKQSFCPPLSTHM